jgi:uncharacterized protein (TIGR02996 family)
MEILPEIARGANDPTGRLVIADWFEENDRADIASELRTPTDSQTVGELPYGYGNGYGYGYGNGDGNGYGYGYGNGNGYGNGDGYGNGNGDGNGDGARPGPPPNGPAAPRRESNGAGSGLGLSIVQAIARAHGGQATLESWPGRGTRVRIWLPAAVAP